MTLYTCEFPLPPKSCSPNVMSAGMGGRMGHARATRQYRDECCLKAKYALSCGSLPKRAEKAVMHISFYCGPVPNCIARDGRYRPRDAPNGLSAFKAGIDGIVDAGVLVADDYRHLSIGRVVLHRRSEEHKGRSCVEVTLEVSE